MTVAIPVGLFGFCRSTDIVNGSLDVGNSVCLSLVALANGDGTVVPLLGQCLGGVCCLDGVAQSGGVGKHLTPQGGIVFLKLRAVEHEVVGFVNVLFCIAGERAISLDNQVYAGVVLQLVGDVCLQRGHLLIDGGILGLVACNRLRDIGSTGFQVSLLLAQSLECLLALGEVLRVVVEGQRLDLDGVPVGAGLDLLQAHLQCAVAYQGGELIGVQRVIGGHGDRLLGIVGINQGNVCLAVVGVAGRLVNSRCVNLHFVHTIGQSCQLLGQHYASLVVL